MLICLLLAGCRNPAERPPAGGPISKLQLLTSPGPLNLDDKPGPDGIAAQVYALADGRAQAVPVTAGILELLIFEDSAPSEPGQFAAAKPWRSWSFTPAELVPRGKQSFAGTGYNFVLTWATPPMAAKISIVSRYTPPAGSPIYSAPVSVLIHSD